MKPTIGRIVIYTGAGRLAPSVHEVPAIVTGVNEDGTVDLTAFPPGVTPTPLRGIPEKGGEPKPDAAGNAPRIDPGSWSWPPRSDE